MRWWRVVPSGGRVLVVVRVLVVGVCVGGVASVGVWLLVVWWLVVVLLGVRVVLRFVVRVGLRFGVLVPVVGFVVRWLVVVLPGVRVVVLRERFVRRFVVRVVHRFVAWGVVLRGCRVGVLGGVRLGLVG